MAEISTTTTLSAPPEKVWSVLTDYEQYGRWNTMHTGFPDGKPTFATGAVFNESVSLLGLPAQIRWTVTQIEPSALWSMQGQGPMGVRVRQRYVLASNAQGTSLTMDVEFTGAAIGMMSARLSKETASALTESLHRITGLVEEANRSDEANVGTGHSLE
jgi:hypothetical protein